MSSKTTSAIECQILDKLKDNKRKLENQLATDEDILADTNHPSRARSFGVNKTTVKLLKAKIQTLHHQILDVECIIEANQ